jgi:aminopeptidase C
MEYDAHVAPPAALNKLYDLLAAHVPVDRAQRVHAYVSAREQRIRDQREQVMQYFAREVIELRRSEVVASVPRENYTKERGKQVALEALRNEVGGRLISYVDFCAKAYGFGHAFKQLSHLISKQSSLISEMYFSKPSGSTTSRFPASGVMFSLSV